MMRRGTSAIAWVVLAALVSSAPALAAGGGVGSVSNPPSKPSRHFTLRIAGGASRVTLYVSLFRRQKQGRVKLGSFRVRHHQITVTLPARLPASGYFLIACPSSGPGACVSSKRPVVVLPSASAVSHSGTATPAPTGGGSAAIGEAGGTLQASSPSASITLQVPAGSLPNDNLTQCSFQEQFGFPRRVCPTAGAFGGETISLAPLASLAGTGTLGRFLTGAQLAPAGLLMIHGGTVSFVLHHRLSAKHLVAVSYAGTGADLHAVPFRISHGVVVVSVAETGGGVAILQRRGGTARDVEPAGDVRPADASEPAGDGAFYGQLISGMLQELVASGHDIGDHSQQWDDTQSAIASTLSDWKQDILSNELPAGLNDDAAASVAIHDLLDEARTAALLGMGNGDVPPEVVRLLAGVYNRAQQRCADTPGFSSESIREILSAYRDLVLAGHPDDVSIDQLLACMHFKLTFDSTITTVWGGSDHGTQINEYQVVMPIKPSSDATALTGQAPGSYLQATGNMYEDPQDCGDTGGGSYVSHSDEVSGNGVTAQVPTFTLPSARIGGPAPQLELQLGQPTETYHLYNTGDSSCDGDATSQLPLWFGNFLLAHKGEVDGTVAAPGAYVFMLTPGSGQTIETRTYDQTYASGDNTETEHTTITILHTPASFAKL